MSAVCHVYLKLCITALHTKDIRRMEYALHEKKFVDDCELTVY
jgi:hypothetical protein